MKKYLIFFLILFSLFSLYLATAGDLIKTVSVPNGTEISYNNWQYVNNSGVVLLAKGTEHCDWKPDYINDGYKICHIIIQGENPNNYNLTVDSMSFKLDKDLIVKNKVYNISFSNNYSNYNDILKIANDITITERKEFNNWTELGTKYKTTYSSQYFAYKIDFEIPQYEKASYNFSIGYKKDGGTPIPITLDPDVSDCGTLSSAGVYTLTADITNTPSSCFLIENSDITLNLNGHTIDGDCGSTTDKGILQQTESRTNITVANGTIQQFGDGIYFLSTGTTGTGHLFTNLTIAPTTTSNCASSVGIMFTNNENSTISNNTIRDTGWGGIWTGDNDINITIANNTFKNNGLRSILLGISSTGNTIYNNLFNDTTYIFANAGSSASWNTTKTLITNIVSKTYIGGNYYTNSTGNGHSDTCVDHTGDWICEDSYTLASNNIDYLPLTTHQDLSAPTIVLNNPIDTYNSTTTSNIFSANVSDDVGISYVILYGNFSGSWAKNSTNTSVVNGTQVNFTVALPNGYYKWTYWANDTGVNSTFNSTNRTLKVDTTSPTITINQPIDGGSYSNNNSINLNYTITDALSTLGSCVYNVINATGTQIANTTLSTCANTTFGLPGGDHNYNLTLYANDSLGNMGLKLIVFSIRTNAPAIILDYPTNDLFLNNANNIYFNFTATDSDDISMCRLYSNFTGTWGINESFTSVSTGVQVNTKKNLTDNPYLWTTWCNDTLNNGNYATLNYTVVIDTVNPSVDNLSITTTAGSQTFNFSFNATDTNLNNCFYTVFNSTGEVDPSTTVNTSLSCNSGSHAETVSAYGTYTLTTYAEDSAGNENSTSLNFSVSASSGATVGGGGTTIIKNITLSNVSLVVTPRTIDSFWLRTKNSVNFTITSNKPLKSCFSVFPTTNHNFYCLIDSSNNYTAYLYLISNITDITYLYDNSVGWTSEDNETVYQKVHIRQVSISGSAWWTLGLQLWVSVIIYVFLLGLFVYIVSGKVIKGKVKRELVSISRNIK